MTSDGIRRGVMRPVELAMRSALLHQFVAVGFGLAAFAVAYALGTALTLGTGIPLLGGVANGLFVSMILTVGLVAVNRPGTSSIMWITLSVLAIPTTTLGPPGLYKVIIGLVAGIIWDLVYFAGRKSTMALFLGAIVAASAIMGLLLLALYFGFGLNAAANFEKYMNALVVLMAVNITVTALGVFLGRQLYVSRLAPLGIFRNLRPEDDG